MPAQPSLNILFVATEVAPFAKEGGVADVAGSLPKALAALGHDVRIAVPRYGTISPERWNLKHTGVTRAVCLGNVDERVDLLQSSLPDSLVTVYFLEHEGLFGRHQRIYLGQDQWDEQRRFVLFCRGLLECLPALSFAPDIVHLNDWQTAPAAVYLRATYRPLLRRGALRVIYTIHNLQYQGRWDPSILDEAGLDRTRVFVPQGLEFWGDVNWMKAGINYADAVTSVSRRYAEEIQTLDQGWGLDEVLFQRHPRVFGIPNGIDWEVWNPATDPELKVRYTPRQAMRGKRANRAALLEEFGLPPDESVPVIGIVSRLVDQKGFDLLAEIAAELREMPARLIVLGSGQPRYEKLFRDLSSSTDNVRARIGFDVGLSHRIYAGSDFFLMPSAFEPGGLGQLIALRYGTPPIVRATGGLADTVTDVDADPEHGNGLSFTEYAAEALLATLQRAFQLFADRERWTTLVKRAMAYDSRWTASARAYADLYHRVLHLPPL